MWPDDPPRDPKGWLVAVAWRRFLDAARAETSRRHREVRVEVEPMPGPAEAVDDTLQLYFLCAHPSPGRAEMRPDGDLVLSNAQGHKLWSTGSGHCPGHGVSLNVTDDGDLVLMTAARRPVWSRLGHPPADKCSKPAAGSGQSVGNH